MGQNDYIFRCVLIGVLLLTCLIYTPTTAGTDLMWPQLRGTNCSGIGAVGSDPPIHFGPETNVIWKITIPPGHSSPCIWEDKIFITAFEKEIKQLHVFCLNRMTGEIQWKRTVPAKQIERVHPISSPATATPAADGDHIYVYFGSYGLLAYDFHGRLFWKVPLPIPKTRFGSGTSPVVTGELVILNRDEQNNPCLLAFARSTGKIVWNTPQPPVSELGATSYASPVIWGDQVVIHRTGEIVAYSLEEGELDWSISTLSMGTSTPVVTEDLLFVGTWTNFGEPELRVDLPDFQTLAGQYDKDGDGQVSRHEFPGDLALARRPEVGDLPGGTIFVKPFFGKIDINVDGQIDEREWKEAMSFLLSFYKDHGLVAVRAGGGTDPNAAYVAWKVSRDVPEVPSPLYYEGCVYMVKNGGVITCMNAQDGKVLYRERLGASGPYYSSPIIAGGRIYTASAKGMITVLPVGKKFQALARNDLGEPVFATPAVVENTLYVRSHNHMYAFGKKN